MAFRQTAARTLFLLIAVGLSGCIGPLSPGAICSSDDTLDRVADIVFGNASVFTAWTVGGERRVIVDESFRADVRRRFRARLGQITLTQSDNQTGRITCSAVYESDHGEALAISYDSAPNLSDTGRVVRVVEILDTTMDAIRGALNRELREAYAPVETEQADARDNPEPGAALSATGTDEFFALTDNGRVRQQCYVAFDDHVAIAGDCIIDTMGRTSTSLIGVGGHCDVSLRRNGQTTTAVLSSYRDECNLASSYRTPLPLSFGEVSRDGPCYRSARALICVGSQPYDFPSSAAVRQSAQRPPQFDPSALDLGPVPSRAAAPAPSARDVMMAVAREVQPLWEPDCETAQPGLFRIQLGVASDGRITSGPTLRSDVQPEQLRNVSLAIGAATAAAPFDLPRGANAQTLTLAFDTTTACRAAQ